MSKLRRTQIYIDSDQMNQLKLEAHQDNVSISDLIRTAISKYLRNKQKNIDWKKDPLFKAAGFIKGSETDLSTNHDHYLYGMKKKSIE